ncbi:MULTISPECIES: SRPBCC family protein [Anaerolinea]|uniref:Coenzyme Q-binding protein COQ10 START domain-containing protein n=1 Tax=Anaerolinea thermophila (strain DSM 14523 / JCM 11388 / NBRC 100420 / UNI-1) TaxID=926569 RepID=E8N4L6_ANATU|nr:MULTISPECIES: hypothetical protein [Anaerolinea]BAJ63380.1 hypothetical protein ANT_13480 [Anaerolinea thermophila UNI-1]
MKKFADVYNAGVPVEKIANFHFSKDAIKQLSPPGIGVQILSHQPLSEGSVTHFRLWIGPIPIEWEAQHQKVSWDSGFIDIQRKGPFKYWEHHHEWKSISKNETQMREYILCEHAPNLKGMLTRLLFNALAMKFFFWYRRKKISNLA